jgi:Cu/Ag efflux pump CusA
MYQVLAEAPCTNALVVPIFAKLGTELNASHSISALPRNVALVHAFGNVTETVNFLLIHVRKAIENRRCRKKLASIDERCRVVVELAIYRLRSKLLTGWFAIFAKLPMVITKGLGEALVLLMTVLVPSIILLSDEVIDRYLPVHFY